MLSRLLTNKFVRNVILVATGTAGAQAITLAFSPVITRLYGPEAFGLLGTFTAVLAVVTPIAALTYPIAIVLPKNDDNARGLAKLSLILALCISLAIALVFFIAEKPIARLLNIEALVGYLMLVPLAMFLDSSRQIMQQWLIRKKQFKVTARIAISQSLVLNSAKTGAGFIHPAGTALIVLTTLGHALYAVQLWLGARRWSSVEDYIHRPTKAIPCLKSLAHQHRDFPIYRAPQVFINAISQSLPVLLLASFFGPAVAGFYTLSRSVMAAPADLLGNSVGNVFFAQIAEAVNEGKDPRPYLQKATLGALAIATPPFVVIMIWGAPIFSFIFGEQWYTAGQYAQWIAVWLLFSLAARPVIATIPVIGMQGWFLVAEIIFTSLRAALMIAAMFISTDPLITIIIFCIASSCFYITLIYLILSGPKIKL